MASQISKGGKKGGKKSVAKDGKVVVRFEAAVVRIHRKGDGRLDLIWREEGRERRTTRGTEDVARAFAEAKARELAGKTGRQWVRPGEAEAVEALRRLAGAKGVGWIVGELRGAVEALGGDAGRLRAAVDFFVNQGGGKIERVALGAAKERVMRDYDDSPPATRTTMGTALRGLVGFLGEEREVAAIAREDIEGWCFQAGLSKRTIKNRITQAATFFARCRELGMMARLAQLPTEGLRRPRLDDVAPAVFSPTVMARFYSAVGRECPRYLPYLLLAGWMGCRPSECLRLKRGALDLEAGMLHLDPRVVGKTARERWVPVRTEIAGALRRAVEEFPARDGRLCLKASRERLSMLARSMGIEWPADVLRHSAITYLLQVHGGDYNAVAEMAGNSPKVIRECYRRPIPPGWGAAWMAIPGMG